MSYKKLLKEAEVVVATAPSSELSDVLTKILADGFLFYFKAHSFHWNVTGSNFSEYHAFFATVYEAVFDNIDRLAEEIRALDATAPKSLMELIGVASIAENKADLDARSMVAALASDNEKILAGLLSCQKMAEAANEVGLANFLQDLFDSHKKFRWMFKSILKD